MIQAAQDLKIDLDSNMVREVNAFTSRLISERNLRKQRELFSDSILTSDHKKVGILQGLIDNATENQVEKDYIENASELTSQMSGNIKARETLQMLLDYPIREYPEAEDPNDKKSKDKKAPPKKKKKEPPFPLPDWAEELDEVVKKYKEMEQLAQKKDLLKLDDAFIVKTNEQLQRFKKEIAYRKMLEDEARREAEEKALKKAKAAKKK
jgi:hypothetical protein